MTTATEDELPLAVLERPPLTEEYELLAVFPVPPLTEANAPLIPLPAPATIPPKLVNFCAKPRTRLWEPVCSPGSS